MRRIVTYVGVSAVCLITGYLSLFQREAVADMADSARGYPRARTPHECTELFRKAVAARRYDKAARYCTREYADQLARGADAGRAVGEALDELTAQLAAAGGASDEVELVLHYHDPLPPRLGLAVRSAGPAEATALLGVTQPRLQGYYPSGWPADTRFTRALYAYVPGTIRLVRQDDYWKLDLPAGPELRAQVDALVSHAKEYAAAFRTLASEVRDGRTGREQVDRRLKELLDEAGRVRR